MPVEEARLVQRAARMVAESAQGAVSLAPAGVAAGVSGLGVGAVRAGGPRVVNYSPTFNFHAEGPIGSRMELQDWLARALDTAARTGRLPRSVRVA